MIKGKKILLLSLTSGASIAMAIAGATFASRKNVRMNVHGDLHDASCVWNHYDAVMPTTSEHGSQEFWACCTHAGNFVFEEPEVNNPSQITDCGQLSGAYFADLANDDARYIPQLEAVSSLDLISPATVSDMGFTSGGYAKTGGEGHTFLDYKFSENGGADVWMKYRYSYFDGAYDEAALQLYVLNNHSEDGLRIRLDTRAENDLPVLYVSSSGQYNNPGTDNDIPSSASPSAMFFFPRPAMFKADTDITLHFAITLIDPVNYTYNVVIEAGSNGTLYQISSGAEAGDYTPRSFNIEMGSGFSGWGNQSFRFSAKHSNDIILSDMASAESVVVYKDAAGNALGKISNPGTAKMPHLKVANKTALGWFDPKGARLTNGAAVSSKHIVTPRFVDTQTNMFNPSDALNGQFAVTKGGWFESTSFEGEYVGNMPVSEISDRFDVYFIYHFVSRTAGDNYAIFGMPYDNGIDGKTRVLTRIDNPTNVNLSGYIYGPNTNLGNAGGDGTGFVQSGFRANGSDLLVHMTVSNASAAGVTYGLELINLGDGGVFTTSRNVTFNDATLYSFNDPARNALSLLKINCEYRITDAF